MPTVKWCSGSVAGDGGVDVARPVVDASGERLDVFEALVAEPHGDVEGASPVMAEDDNGLVGVEFLMGARGYFAHRHQEGVRQAGGIELPWFADVKEERSVRLTTLFKKCLGSDFGVEHRFKNN